MTSRLAMFIATVLFAVPFFGGGRQKYASGYIKGSSDWWSILNDNFRAPAQSPENRSFASSNVKIAGESFREADLFDLGGDPFGPITASLGKAGIIQRGEAATGRSQICYTSAAHPGAMYLVFESGESELNFYVFDGGAPWKGSDRCTRSPFVSRSLATDSGMRLGMSATQAEAVLGKPTATSRSRLIYWGTTLRKTPAEVLNKLRQRNPNMSPTDFQADFAQYDLTIYIEVRFSAGKMIYLAVSENTT